MHSLPLRVICPGPKLGTSQLARVLLLGQHLGDCPPSGCPESEFRTIPLPPLSFPSFRTLACPAAPGRGGRGKEEEDSLGDHPLGWKRGLRGWGESCRTEKRTLAGTQVLFLVLKDSPGHHPLGWKRGLRGCGESFRTEKRTPQEDSPAPQSPLFRPAGLGRWKSSFPS